MTDQQIDEFLEMLAKSPTSARDMVRGLFAANEAKAAPAEPFGYFRAEPFGWTDCAAIDEGAIALYERPAAPAVPDTDELESALERLVERCNTDQFLSNDDAVIHAEATLERIYKSRQYTHTPAAPSQPVTLTDEEIFRCAALTLGEQHVENCGLGDIKEFARAIIAALREKGALR